MSIAFQLAEAIIVRKLMKPKQYEKAPWPLRRSGIGALIERLE